MRRGRERIRQWGDSEAGIHRRGSAEGRCSPALVRIRMKAGNSVSFRGRARLASGLMWNPKNILLLALVVVAAWFIWAWARLAKKAKAAGKAEAGAGHGA